MPAVNSFNKINNTLFKAIYFLIDLFTFLILKIIIILINTKFFI